METLRRAWTERERQQVVQRARLPRRPLHCRDVHLPRLADERIERRVKATAGGLARGDEARLERAAPLEHPSRPEQEHRHVGPTLKLSLHADTWLHENDVVGLERLCNDGARGLLSLEPHDSQALERFYEDSERLGLRRRRLHDTRRTFRTLCLVGGAQETSSTGHPRAARAQRRARATWIADERPSERWGMLTPRRQT